MYNTINLSDLKKKEPVWWDIEGAPEGKITTLNQYLYMIYYSQISGLNFYWTREDRHIPSFKECKNKFLTLIDFFGGGSYFFRIEEEGIDWNYGYHGIVINDEDI